MKTGLIVAMQSEFELVSKLLASSTPQQIHHLKFITGTLNGQEIILMQAGIGKVNAAVAAVEMIKNFAPDRIINTGLAGGIDKNLSVMDIVFGQSVVYHDVWCGEGNYGQVHSLPAQFAGDSKLLKAAQNLQSDVKTHFGLITSGDKFITSSEELSSIKQLFPQALAVDMESAAIAQICHLYTTPFLAIRIISDTPGIENHYQQYLDFWNHAPEKLIEIIRGLL